MQSLVSAAGRLLTSRGDSYSDQSISYYSILVTPYDKHPATCYDTLPASLCSGMLARALLLLIIVFYTLILCCTTSWYRFSCKKPLHTLFVSFMHNFKVLHIQIQPALVPFLRPSLQAPSGKFASKTHASPSMVGSWLQSTRQNLL